MQISRILPDTPPMSEPKEFWEWVKKYVPWVTTAAGAVYGFASLIVPVWNAMSDDIRRRVLLSFAIVGMSLPFFVYWAWGKVRAIKKRSDDYLSFRDPRRWSPTRMLSFVLLGERGSACILSFEKTTFHIKVGVRNSSPFDIYPRHLKMNWKVLDHDYKRIASDTKEVSDGFEPIPPGGGWSRTFKIEVRPYIDHEPPCSAFFEVGGVFTFDVDHQKTSLDLELNAQGWGAVLDERPYNDVFKRVTTDTPRG